MYPIFWKFFVHPIQLFLENKNIDRYVVGIDKSNWPLKIQLTYYIASALRLTLFLPDLKHWWNEFSVKNFFYCSLTTKKIRLLSFDVSDATGIHQSYLAFLCVLRSSEFIYAIFTVMHMCVRENMWVNITAKKNSHETDLKCHIYTSTSHAPNRFWWA